MILRRSNLRKLLFALSGLAVTLSAAPAVAKDVKGVVCTKYVNGVCTDTHKVRYKVGYVFGPTYSYTAISDIPPAVVTQYSLSPDSRYVYADGYIYVVDPSTYAVTRVITV